MHQPTHSKEDSNHLFGFWPNIVLQLFSTGEAFEGCGIFYVVWGNIDSISLKCPIVEVVHQHNNSWLRLCRTDIFSFGLYTHWEALVLNNRRLCHRYTFACSTRHIWTAELQRIKKQVTLWHILDFRQYCVASFFIYVLTHIWLRSASIILNWAPHLGQWWVNAVAEVTKRKSRHCWNTSRLSLLYQWTEMIQKDISLK